jgi:hypothetical protein
MYLLNAAELLHDLASLSLPFRGSPSLTFFLQENRWTAQCSDAVALTIITVGLAGSNQDYNSSSNCSMVCRVHNGRKSFHSYALIACRTLGVLCPRSHVGLLGLSTSHLR